MNSTGRQIAVTDALNHTSHYEYDNLGRLVVMRDAAGNETSYEYDALGRRIAEIDANNHRTEYDYDAMGRLETTTFADGATTQYAYDALGRRTGMTDPNNLITSYSYDVLGRLLAVTNPMQQRTSYAYDALGQVTAITDANNHSTQFEYDALGQLESKIWADGRHDSFTYDYVGNLLREDIAVDTSDAVSRAYIYDSMNRLNRATYSDGTDYIYTYTERGEREQVLAADNMVLSSYSYDNLGRPTRIEQPLNNQWVSYGYDELGNRTQVATPASTVDYTYDTLNRVASVTDIGGTTTLGYDAVGQLLTMQRPNGIDTTYAYNERNFLMQLTHSNTDLNTPVAEYGYSYDAAGNRTQMVENDSLTTNWVYDAAYRLLSEEREMGGASLFSTYTYDAVGNRLSEINPLGETNRYQYNALDQITDVYYPEYHSTAYDYDARGNLIATETNTSVRTTYQYDARDQLLQVSSPGFNVSYRYDHNGQRVQQTANGTVTNYLWDEFSAYGDVLLETDVAYNPQTSYTLAQGIILSQTRGGETYYFLKDAQHSTRALTDSSGAVSQSYAYDAFGNLQIDTESLLTNYLYTGQQFDGDTGLYSLRARYYNPALGRFMSQDAWAYDYQNPIELNRYAYAANNPIRYSDPSGYLFIEDQGLNTTSKVAGSVFLRYFAQQAAKEAVRVITRTWLPLILSPVGLVFGELIQALLDPVVNPSPNPAPAPAPAPVNPDTDTDTDDDDDDDNREIVLLLGPGANIEGEVVPLVNFYRGRAKVIGVEKEPDKAVLLGMNAQLYGISSEDFEVVNSSFANDLPISKCASAIFGFWPNLFGTRDLHIPVQNHLCEGGEFYFVTEVVEWRDTIVQNLGASVNYHFSERREVGYTCINNPIQTSCINNYGRFAPGIGKYKI